MSLAQVRPLRGIVERVHGYADDADRLAEMIYEGLLTAADRTERVADAITKARAEVQRLDALLAAAAGANNPCEAMRNVADEMRERLGLIIRTIKIETATGVRHGHDPREP